MQRILLFICFFCTIACTSNKNKEVVDYYSPIKSRLKEFIIQTKTKDIRICLPNNIATYKDVVHITDIDKDTDERWYESKSNDYSIHITIFKNEEFINGTDFIQQGINSIKVEDPNALIYTKQLTNNIDTIFHLCYLSTYEKVTICIQQTCSMIKDNIVYVITLNARSTNCVIDLELYDEIMKTIRIVD